MSIVKLMFVEEWRIIAHYCVDVMRKIAHIVTINRTQKANMKATINEINTL